MGIKFGDYIVWGGSTILIGCALALLKNEIDNYNINSVSPSNPVKISSFIDVPNLSNSPPYIQEADGTYVLTPKDTSEVKESKGTSLEGISKE